MVITETEVKVHVVEFKHLDPRKWFQQLVTAHLRACDPFQNHTPCWMDKNRRITDVDND